MIVLVNDHLGIQCMLVCNSLAVFISVQLIQKTFAGMNVERNVMTENMLCYNIHQQLLKL